MSWTWYISMRMQLWWKLPSESKLQPYLDLPINHWTVVRFLWEKRAGSTLSTIWSVSLCCRRVHCKLMRRLLQRTRSEGRPFCGAYRARPGRAGPARWPGLQVGETKLQCYLLGFADSRWECRFLVLQITTLQKKYPRSTCLSRLNSTGSDRVRWYSGPAAAAIQPISSRPRLGTRPAGLGEPKLLPSPMTTWSSYYDRPGPGRVTRI